MSTENFAKNLRNLCIARRLSFAEFSRELGIPKTTLQSILEDGNTSLYTAIHISEGVCVSLDTLTNGIASPQQINRLDSFMSLLKWYDGLPKNKQEEACRHILTLFQLMVEGYDE